MILSRSLSKLPVALTLSNSLVGAFTAMTVSAETLKIAETMIVSCNDMIYFSGPQATYLTPVTVPGENKLPELVPMTR